MAMDRSRTPSEIAQVRARHLTLSLLVPPGKSISQTASCETM